MKGEKNEDNSGNQNGNNKKKNEKDQRRGKREKGDRDIYRIQYNSDSSTNLRRMDYKEREGKHECII